MAFAYTVDRTENFGSLTVKMGTFTNGAGDSGGNITTGLKQVVSMTLQSKGTAVVATAPVINETFPISGAVTIVTALDEDGYWVAYGYE